LKMYEPPRRFHPLLASMTEVLWLIQVVAGCFQQNAHHHRCLKPRVCMELCESLYANKDATNKGRREEEVRRVYYCDHGMPSNGDAHVVHTVSWGSQ
jgi:hypothetical protein